MKTLEQALHVRTTFFDDGIQYGCMFAPTGVVIIEEGRWTVGRPCNRKECRRCDPLRAQLFDIGMTITREKAVKFRAEISGHTPQSAKPQRVPHRGRGPAHAQPASAKGAVPSHETLPSRG